MLTHGTHGKENIAYIKTAPKQLNNKWITAALRAFLFVPTLESIAVTHVPIFVPISTNNAPSSGIKSPCMAKACKIPMEAEEL